jgi:hypothetical protein
VIFRSPAVKLGKSKRLWRREGREKDDDRRLLNGIERETDINIEFERDNLITLKIYHLFPV